MEESTKLRRITYKLKCPNPLFIKWMQEWKDEAENKNMKSKFVLALALESLKKYPLPLESGRDCAVLQGFGKTLCSMLDNKLEEYNQMRSKSSYSNDNDKPICDDFPFVEPIIAFTQQETSAQELIKKRHKSTGKDTNDQLTSPNKNAELFNIDKIQKSNKQKHVKCLNNKLYSPAFRSGAYAILVILIKSLKINISHMSKLEIQTQAQKLCDKSFIQADSGSRYTAWSSMSTLISKNLVCKYDNPAKFSLSEEGIIVAEELIKKYVDSDLPNDEFQPNLEIVDQVLLQDKQINIKNTKADKDLKEDKVRTIEFDMVIFQSNSFDTILLVDTQETSGIAKKAYDETIQGLTQSNVKFEIRRLNVGDFAWICRDKSERELLLPYIVERKRMDDFGSSIKDGRFREQKFRLKNCGIQNLIYLIESYRGNEHTGLPMSTLLQAACNTSVQDGFTIKFTNNHKDSIMYLALMTRMLSENIKNKTLISCPKENLKVFTFDDDIIALMDFTEFQNISIKTKHFSVQNMFIKHLMKIKGISVDKALSIVAKYSTPRILYEAYLEHSAISKEKMLASTPFGPMKKKIGPTISEIVYHLFTRDKYF